MDLLVGRSEASSDSSSLQKGTSLHFLSWQLRYVSLSGCLRTILSVPLTALPFFRAIILK